MKEFLRNNPVFWSRLGFAYDPPMRDENGDLIVFNSSLEKYGNYHRSFSKIGVNLHTCILPSGWVGVNEYDYSLTDKVMDEVFRDNEDIYFIPRIKLNVPIDWCYENPEDVFVYYGGPETADEIRNVVGTLQHDYIGYDSPHGYYASGEFEDTRPNVGGVIARQSFSSKKWLEDAREALTRVINRLENGKYGKRILGYHIAYGTSGETVVWGRVSNKYGDWGINNKKAFFEWSMAKYGSLAEIEKAWGMSGISPDNFPIPSPELRQPTNNSFEEFVRASKDGAFAIDYDMFMSQTNANALEFFGKTVKELTGKPVGAFYGYYLHVDNAAYTGHLALERLLNSPYVDFFSAPKSYYRCKAGEPGGELSATQSINLKKLWLEELDNRTHLDTLANRPNYGENDTEWESGGMRDTKTVFWREYAKNLSHNSGFWWMDLGGGWFDDDEILKEFKKIADVNKELRKKPHESASDVLIVTDERSAYYMRANRDMRCGFAEDFIAEARMTGALVDTYRARDLFDIDLTKYKLVVFAYNTYADSDYFEKILPKLTHATVMFNYAPGVWSEKGFDINRVKEITGFDIEEINDKNYDVPLIRSVGQGKANYILNTTPYMKHSDIREIMKKAGCHIYTEAEGVTVYGDDRFISVFNSSPVNLTLSLKQNALCKDLVTGTEYSDCKIELNCDTNEAHFIVYDK
ncbi:MAG: hypothetical protein E7613_08350 [Ruminococcaceae bacterium]|nr:hypothetical protein [Oscillospiraceae bacterium]